MPSQLQVIGLDKLAHVSAYEVITLLFIHSLRNPILLLAASLLDLQLDDSLFTFQNELINQQNYVIKLKVSTKQSDDSADM